ncbi:unnamed protein product [Brassica oleracea var. botrytis]|uniref:Uncharacterized protein n=2 Tax=Brassica TaxID=3705 RepID=A0A3P6FGP3_BRAOL|nr:hypothetical protein HID58_043717 [Brassica napus]CAF2077792.1 unnamed protein product [Brassica napus]VDD52098.1 unnamed protein product [Brassica oleracea]
MPTLPLTFGLQYNDAEAAKAEDEDDDNMDDFHRDEILKEQTLRSNIPQKLLPDFFMSSSP